ncbi:MAG: hypothetical protein U0X75_28535 [Acidobacteriota bacterium]
MGIPLYAGRNFTTADTNKTEQVTMLSEVRKAFISGATLSVNKL